MQKKSSIYKGFTPKTLSQWLTATLFFVLFPFFACVAAEIDPIDDTVQKLQRVYEETNDFRADFRQETFNKSLKKTLTEEGIVFFKKPRNMLWDYAKPDEKKLIINPQKAWLYLPREKTAYVQKADTLFQSATIIRFLSGLGNLKDDFDIAYAEPNPTDKNGNYLLKLTPKEKSSALQVLSITLDKNTFFIIQVSFEDLMGNITTLKFSSIAMNAGLSDKLFKFQPPAGTNIFDMP
ncbi:MAG TPA: outer membrane lipoprotein carrier protein LolA [Smithellaceae bacterium]|jgi:outer membrane lipoprotein carrier protein|nr:outer membrane lipoprotein carrier protein LolA [Smithellaceae bacterium]